MESHFTFAIASAEKEDIEELLKVVSESSSPDKHTQFKSLLGYNHERAMTDAMKHWFALPPESMRLLKAVDTSTGNILGWACWGSRGVNLEDISEMLNASNRNSTDHDSKITTNTPNANQNLVRGLDAHNVAESKSHEILKRLETVTSEDLKMWMNRLMPTNSPTKCMFIRSFIVRPAYQRRGIGTALMNAGLNLADKEGVFCWVHSSEAGAPFFMRHQFVEIGKMELNLNEWASDADLLDANPDGAEWGKYTMRYLKREPRALGSGGA